MHAVVGGDQSVLLNPLLVALLQQTPEILWPRLLAQKKLLMFCSVVMKQVVYKANPKMVKLLIQHEDLGGQNTFLIFKRWGEKGIFWMESQCPKKRSGGKKNSC